MALAKKRESLLVEFKQEEARLNSEIDAIMAKIRDHKSTPAFDSKEFEQIITAKIDAGAARFEETGKKEFHDPANMQLIRTTFIANRRPEAVPPSVVAEHLANGFYFLLKHNPAARAEITKLAPMNGINSVRHAEIAKQLEEELFQSYVSLEALYVEAESCGLSPKRRPDLSPPAVLAFRNPNDWNRSKLEGSRERLRSLRATGTSLTEKRTVILQSISKIEALFDEKNEDKQLASQIKDTKRELAEIDETIRLNHLEVTRETNLFNSLIRFLRQNKVTNVDDRI